MAERKESQRGLHVLVFGRAIDQSNARGVKCNRYLLVGWLVVDSCVRANESRSLSDLWTPQEPLDGYAVHRPCL